MDPPKLQVCVLVCSDTVLPGTESQFVSGIDASILAANQYYWDMARGHCFTAAPTVLYRDPRTEAQVLIDGADLAGIWWTTLPIMHNLKLINLCSPWRYNLFTTPCPFTDPSYVGFATTMGVFSTSGIPCIGHVWPGTAMIGSAGNGLALAGYDVPNESFARGVLVHELGHGLGAEMYPSELPLPHTSLEDPQSQVPNIMSGGTYPTTGFTNWQLGCLLRSPFLTFQALRPE